VATDTEARVLGMLGAIEPPPDAAEQIEAMGPQAVAVACDAALGTYIELRPKVRTNAAAIVGRMNNDQARETLALLVTDPSEDVAIRALRALGRRDEPELARRAGLVLQRAEVSPLLAAEAVNALAATPARDAAREVLDEYSRVEGPGSPAHRRHPLVAQALERAQR
jgi:HEAT repeat protein